MCAKDHEVDVSISALVSLAVGAMLISALNLQASTTTSCYSLLTTTPKICAIPVVFSSDRRRVQYILVPRRTGPPDQGHGCFASRIPHEFYQFTGMAVSAVDIVRYGEGCLRVYTSRVTGKMHTNRMAFTATGGL